MTAFFFWYGIVCAGCVVVLVGSVLLTLAEGVVRQRITDRRARAVDVQAAQERPIPYQLTEIEAWFRLPAKEPNR